MAGKGHEDQFLPPKLNARCRFVEETFAETSANGRDAPRAAAVAGERVLSGEWPRNRRPFDDLLLQRFLWTIERTVALVLKGLCGLGLYEKCDNPRIFLSHLFFQIYDRLLDLGRQHRICELQAEHSDDLLRTQLHSEKSGGLQTTRVRICDR
jgi:hypothetical protein